MRRSVDWLALLLFCGLSSGVQARKAPFPLVAASYLVKSDTETLWERGADERLPPRQPDKDDARAAGGGEKTFHLHNNNSLIDRYPGLLG